MSDDQFKSIYAMLMINAVALGVIIAKLFF